VDEQNILQVEESLVAELNAISGLSGAHVVSARRVEADLDPLKVRDVFGALQAKRKYFHVSTISGLDNVKNMQVVYHVVLNNVVASLFATIDRNNPAIDTVKDIIAGVAAYERELYDMFGITVKGNESTSPLVLPDDWPKGVFPLRKDVKLDGGGE